MIPSAAAGGCGGCGAGVAAGMSHWPPGASGVAAGGWNSWRRRLRCKAVSEGFEEGFIETTKASVRL